MPLITITPMAYVDLRLAVDICPVEISGLGDVERHADEWRVVSTIIIPQRCSGAHTGFDQLAYNRYLASLVKAGRRDEADAKGLWWHSHVEGEARFSFVDRDYIDYTFGRRVPRSAANPWLVSIVANKFHSMGVRLDIFHPDRKTYHDPPIRLTVFTPLEEMRRLYQERKPRTEKIIKETVIIDRRKTLLRDDDGEDENGNS